MMKNDGTTKEKRIMEGVSFSFFFEFGIRNLTHLYVQMSPGKSITKWKAKEGTQRGEVFPQMILL